MRFLYHTWWCWYLVACLCSTWNWHWDSSIDVDVSQCGRRFARLLKVGYLNFHIIKNNSWNALNAFSKGMFYNETICWRIINLEIGAASNNARLKSMIKKEGKNIKRFQESKILRMNIRSFMIIERWSAVLAGTFVFYSLVFSCINSSCTKE